MHDRDGWEVWDDGDHDTGRPDGSDAGGSPKRGGNGWLIGLIVGGFFIFTAVAVALFFVFDDERANNPPLGFPAPPPPQDSGLNRFGPGGGLGGPPDDWTPADEDVRTQVRAAFRALGRALQKPDFDPAQYFDLAALSTAAMDAVPGEPNWGLSLQAVGGPGPGGAGIGGPPGARVVDTASAARSYLRSARPTWRKRPWEDIDIRQVLVTQRGPVGDPVLLVMAWQREPDAPSLKHLWHLTRPDGLDGGWKISQWEDTTTGMTGAGEVALDLICRAERRWDLHPFQRLGELHRAIDETRYADAERQVSALTRTRPPAGLFADVCDLAEAKLRHRRSDFMGASAQFEGLSDRPTSLLALSPFLAEAANVQQNPTRALEIGERHTRMYGNDPDVLAHTAAALIALNRFADARKAVTDSLADDPDQLVALDALRKLDGDPEAFLRRVRAAKRFTALFPALARRASLDRDWPALVRLAEEFIARRPNDPSGPETLVRALAQSGDTAAAVRAFARYAPRQSDDERDEMVFAVVAPVSRSGKALELYSLLPDEHRDVFFFRLARDLDLLSDRFKDTDDLLDVMEARKQSVALVAAHAKHRPRAAAVLLFEAKGLIRDKKWAEAEKTLAGIRVPNAARAGEDDSLAVLVRAARLTVFQELKKWDAAFDALTPTRWVLNRLAEPCAAEKRWADLAGILAAYKKKSPDEIELAYWTGTLLAGRARHADAMVEFRKVFDAKPAETGEFDDDEDDELWDRVSDARAGFARSAMKAGKATEAVRVLEADDFPPMALFAAALAAAGDVPRAVRHLEAELQESPFLLNTFYADPDLGPLLETPDFGDFRAKYPKPLPGGAGPGEE